MGRRVSFRFILIGPILAIGLALLVLAGLYTYLSDWFERPGPNSESLTVLLARGSGARAIAERLTAAGVVADADLFVAGVWLEDKLGALKAGEYAFAPRLSAHQVMDRLVAGDTVARRLTIAEGLTSAQVLALVAAADGLAGALETAPGEGELLPETYHFAYGDARAELVRRMQDSMRTVLAELWPAREPELPLQTPEEAVVLASIVEKETGVAAERPLVAGVFINRLRRGMPLQSDPTVIYALTQGQGVLGRPLRRADLATDHPFNTYRHKGLPPGPIANPGRESIAAVLHPAATDALYFVADGSGGHAFARTIAEHQKNVRRWRALRKKQSEAAAAE